MSLKYGTVLATKQEFFFAKLVPRTNHNWHCTIGYLILFFRKEDIYFFECLYFSEYDIGMLLFVFWLRNRPSIKYVRNWRNGGGHPRCVQVQIGERGITPHFYLHTYRQLLFSCFCLKVSCHYLHWKAGVFVYIWISTRNRHSISLK